jgi:hypothetical protein
MVAVVFIITATTVNAIAMVGILFAGTEGHPIYGTTGKLALS